MLQVFATQPKGFKVRERVIIDLRKRGGVVARKKYGKTRKLGTGITFQFMETKHRFVDR